jgi:hypothetical protein
LVLSDDSDEFHQPEIFNNKSHASDYRGIVRKRRVLALKQASLKNRVGSIRGGADFRPGFFTI